MSNNFIWQQNSSNPDNKDSLEAIAQWWSGLDSQEVIWQQRLMPLDGIVENLDWQPQKFDEKLILAVPQMRGITLYWRNKGVDERNITPSKLHLDSTKQKLYVFPQSQSQVVIGISLPATVYQKFSLLNPQVAATTKDGQGIILLRDSQAKLEVTVTLNPSQITQLFDRLKTTDNQ